MVTMINTPREVQGPMEAHRGVQGAKGQDFVDLGQPSRKRLSFSQKRGGAGESAVGRGNSVCKGPEAEESTVQSDWRFQVKTEA